VRSLPDICTEMYSKRKAVNSKMDDVIGMNDTLQSRIQIETLRPLLTFNGDTMIHGFCARCMIYPNTNQVFLPVWQTPCNIFSKIILIISLIMYLNIRKLKLHTKLVVGLKVQY
jgi:hypothetical protein